MLTIFKGDNGKYGVCESGKVKALLYEADFDKKPACRIANLENSVNPPKDWEATEEILRREGYAI